MDQITAISPTKRDPGRGMIKVGGRVVATLAYTLIDELGVTVGQTWDERLAGRVAATVAYDQCLRAALRRLERRAFSRSQLRLKLCGLDFPEDVIERALDRLTELGVLDDAGYGEALVRAILRSKPAGPRLVRQKLFQKGLEAELIDRLVAEAFAGHDQAEDAERLARQKLKTLSRYDKQTQKRRLWGALARRGFDSEAITEVVDAVLGDEQEGD